MKAYTYKDFPGIIAPSDSKVEIVIYTLGEHNSIMRQIIELKNEIEELGYELIEERN